MPTVFLYHDLRIQDNRGGDSVLLGTFTPQPSHNKTSAVNKMCRLFQSWGNAFWYSIKEIIPVKELDSSWIQQQWGVSFDCTKTQLYVQSGAQSRVTGCLWAG